MTGKSYTVEVGLLYFHNPFKPFLSIGMAYLPS